MNDGLQLGVFVVLHVDFQFHISSSQLEIFFCASVSARVKYNLSNTLLSRGMANIYEDSFGGSCAARGPRVCLEYRRGGLKT